MCCNWGTQYCNFENEKNCCIRLSPYLAIHPNDYVYGHVLSLKEGEGHIHCTCIFPPQRMKHCCEMLAHLSLLGRYWLFFLHLHYCQTLGEVCGDDTVSLAASAGDSSEHLLCWKYVWLVQCFVHAYGQDAFQMYLEAILLIFSLRWWRRWLGGWGHRRDHRREKRSVRDGNRHTASGLYHRYIATSSVLEAL